MLDIPSHHDEASCLWPPSWLSLALVLKLWEERAATSSLDWWCSSRLFFSSSTFDYEFSYVPLMM